MRRPGPAVLAVLVWLVCTPIAFVVTDVADLYPFHNRAWALSLASAFVAAGGLLALCFRRAPDALAGVAAGLLAGWVVLTLRITLDGTPFAFGGMSADAGRASAAAVRYSVTVGSSDAFIPGVPPEAPPLFPWLIGRVSALVNVPAWQLVAGAEILGMALAVLVCFLLWLRLTTPWTALVIAALGLLVFGDPRKAHEALTLLAFVPWVLMTFGSPERSGSARLAPRSDPDQSPPRGALHWLPAGIIGGLIALTYQAWYVFGALGILALAYRTWRASEDRRAYLRHLAGVVATAFVVASWHVVPYLWAVATRDARLVSDLFTPFGIHVGMFPFFEPTPLGAIQLVGLAGLVLLRGRIWWATPMLLLAVSAVVYRIVALIPYIPTGHTKFLHYTDSLYGAVFAAAGVLVLAHLAGRLPPVPAGSLATAVAVLLAWVTFSYSQQWFPGTIAATSHYTAAAHREPLPQGGYPQFAPALGRLPWFPVYRIRDAVAAVRGADDRPVTLSPDERLYAYLPWPGYVGTSRLASGSFALWDDRLAELRRLSSLGDPAAFATESADTRFGPIDVFVLRKGATAWVWQEGVTFQPAQFDPAVWAVFDDLPEGYVVVVRRP